MKNNETADAVLKAMREICRQRVDFAARDHG